MADNNGNRGKAGQKPGPEKPAAATQRDRPLHELRLQRVKAAVWGREAEHGMKYWVTFSLVYKDKDGRWQTTECFGRDDLLLLSKVADLAHSWIADATKGQDVPF